MSEAQDEFSGQSATTVAEIALPGAMLRATREAYGLSIPDVAQITRFSARQIDALERDDYASLSGPTQIRGFVRSYAKLLKLDAAPLLAALEPAAPVVVAEVRPPENFGIAEQPALAQRIKPWISVAGLLLLIGVAIAFRILWPEREPSAPPEAVPGIAEQATAVSPANVVAPALTPVAQTPAVTALPALTTEGSVASPPAAVKPPASGLRVEFVDPSWIEIRDATQNVVMSGEYPAGTRQDIPGKPPFQVWIGKASGVRLYMAERSIDLQPYTRAEVARLTVE
ncbi:MAG: hypothetical protein CVU17_10120 [Betaproteobacteria bacterium HGW-Betaproteobacteria-11]|nr:MAG: hypothetical protein CVU17_10120 [Betaproteobacteria bacterium HGW-Betaproteobacteria-11]